MRVVGDVRDGEVEEADAPDELVPRRLVLRDGVPLADAAGEVTGEAPDRPGIVAARYHELRIESNHWAKKRQTNLVQKEIPRPRALTTVADANFGT